MISIEEFEQLTHNEKTRLIIDKAMPVSSISNNVRRVMLYSLSVHFIEVTVNKASKKVESFQVVQGKELDKYVSNLKFVFTGEQE